MLHRIAAWKASHPVSYLQRTHSSTSILHLQLAHGSASRRCLRSMHCNTWRFQSPSSCFRRAWLSTAALPRRCLCMCDIHSRVSAYAFGCPLCQHCCCCFVNHLAYCIWLIISMLTDHVDSFVVLWSCRCGVLCTALSTKFVIGRRRALLVTPSAAPSCTCRQHGSL